MKKYKIILIILLFIIMIIVFKSFFSNENYINIKLNKHGYNKEEIKLIINKLNTDKINYLLKIPYNKSYSKIINNKDFKNKNLIKYINYYKKYKAPINDTIFLINNNIESKYNPKLINLINEKFYKKNNYKRYYNYLIKHNDLSTKEIISMVNCNRDFNFYSTNYKSDLNKGILMIANKYYTLDNFEPKNLVNITSEYGGNNFYIQDIAFENYKKMYNDIKKENLKIIIKSAYRSYQYQNKIYNNYVKKDGKTLADTYSSRPGFSDHQTGLAIDIGTNTTINLEDFENTLEYKWMIKNAHKYGFILRYPKNKENLTGYMFESWHYRYVGTNVATYIKNHDLTFDEYYEYYLNN